MTMALEIKTEIKELSTVERELAVVVPGAAVAKELDKAYRRLSGKVKLKGYRKGKVPRYVLEQYYKGDTEAEVLETLIGQSYRQALSEHALTPVADPKINATPELIAGMDYRYQARVEVKPEITVEQHKGLALVKKVYEVADDAVDKQLSIMRERQVQVTPVEDRDIIQQGDLVECNYSGSIDGENVRGLGGVSFVIEIGAGRFFPEAEQALVGKKLDEKIEVDVAVPEDHRVEIARGKTATLNIKPMELKQKTLPDLDDEFAKDVSEEYETLDALKESIAKNLAEGAENRTKGELREAAVDVLIETNPFEVPAALVSRQAEQLAVEPLRRLPQEQAEQIWRSQHETMIDQARPRALRTVRAGLLLEKLTELEGIEVSDEAVDEKLKEISEQVGQPVRNIRKIYEKNNGLEEIRHQIATEQLLDLIIASAEVTEEKVNFGDDG